VSRGLGRGSRGGNYPLCVLLASLFGIAFLLLLSISMHVPTKALAGVSPLPPLTTNLLFGMATLICTLWVTFLFSLTIHKSLLIWVIALALINVGSFLYLKAKENRKPISYGFGLRDFFIVALVSAISIFPQTGVSISPS